MEQQSMARYLATRRSVPALNLGYPCPDAAEVSQILEWAARVPDHGKVEPWRFIVYSGHAREEIGRYLAALWLEDNPDSSAERVAVEASRFIRAPLVIGVVSRPVQAHKIPLWEQELSAGAVCLNLIHAAFSLGYSAQWLTEWFSYDARCMSYLGLRKGERFAGLMHIGTPMIIPAERPRPQIHEITTHWTAPDA